MISVSLGFKRCVRYAPNNSLTRSGVDFTSSQPSADIKSPVHPCRGFPVYASPVNRQGARNWRTLPAENPHHPDQFQVCLTGAICGRSDGSVLRPVASGAAVMPPPWVTTSKSG